MIGIILIAISWLLLYWEKKPLSVLGFNRPALRSLEFGLGLLVAAMFAALQFLTAAHFGSFDWLVNSEYTLNQFLNGLRFVVNSVLFEELIFRGYLLYKAIQWLGARKGCALSAAAFGVYHWFSYGIWGQWLTMTFVFVMTATFGLMLAMAFYKTGSVFLPTGLHLGWNLVTLLVFSNGSIGRHWLFSDPAGGIKLLQGSEALVINLLLPLALPLLVIVCLAKMKQNQVTDVKAT